MEKSVGGQSAKLLEGYSSSPTRSKKAVKSKPSASSWRGKRRDANVERMKGRPRLDAAMLRRHAALDKLTDDQIHTSDIPEGVNYNRPVYIGLIPGPGKKKRVTIRLDEDAGR